MGSIEDQAESPLVQQLEIALANTNNANFKIIHPLLIKSYRMPTLKFKDERIEAVGLDIETDAANGRPMLLGFWYPHATEKYHYIYRPTLKSFFQVIRDNYENSNVKNFITWGNLDIQCIIRLFAPTEDERLRISRGLSGNVKDGKFIGTPPVVRQIGTTQFYIGHYIPGRSIKLGYIENGFDRTIWIFNTSQFYPGTIAQTAKGLGFEWRDFDRETHLIDWKRFAASPTYKAACIDSNKQDARIVSELADNLQARFNEVFDCYPTLLVSTGSLTDAAVSKMLSDNRVEYQSNSWRWLASNIWRKVSPEDLSKAETLLSEAFSAGYVDQFAVGYFEQVCTADIAAAYPHKIRALPDLRYSNLFVNSGQLETDLESIAGLGWDIETAIIRGIVTIPESLVFHPITVKTFNRENYRPTGTFHATYTLEERKFCERYGATFEDEEYVIVGLSQRKPAPIATVSEKLGEFRNRLLAQLAEAKSEDERKLLDGQQFLIKVVDNSIYGKTVMTTEYVEDIDGTPQITGYIAGDRFNLLYGSLITARTRIQIAAACMAIVANGGKPIMTMTDSIYWDGTPDMLPPEMSRSEKTPGYFESPEAVQNFFILKTGQYEYQTGRDKWHYKLRGLNVNWDEIDGKASFYRRTINQHLSKISPNTHPKDITITVNTRRLISVGSKDLSNLAAIQDGTTELRPFVMSSKQVEKYVTQWRECMNGHLWLGTPAVSTSLDSSTSEYPLRFLRSLYESGVQAKMELRIDNRRKRSRNYYEENKSKLRRVSSETSRKIDDLKRLYIWNATIKTNLPPPPGKSFRLTWSELESYYGYERAELIGSNNVQQ